MRDTLLIGLALILAALIIWIIYEVHRAPMGEEDAAGHGPTHDHPNRDSRQ